MPDEEETINVCSGCDEPVQPDFEFCPNCGTLLIYNVSCAEHENQEAIGVCIICSRPICKKCGLKTDGHFLCTMHSRYEIYEGMTRIYGNTDSVQVELVKSLLEEDGFHPFIYSRKASPLSLGGPDYSLFRSSGEYDGHIINEFKLMVPCQEVEEAELKLKELKFIS